MTTYNRAEPIADEILRRLALRTIALGAETDLGVAVYAGRKFVDDSMIPCAVLIEGEDKPEAQNTQAQYQIAQDYAVLAYLPCDPDNPNAAAHAGIRDIKRALWAGRGREKTTLGGTVKDVAYRGRQIGPRADGAAFVVAVVEFTVVYAEDISDP